MDYTLYGVHDKQSLAYGPRNRTWELRAEEVGHDTSHTGGTDYRSSQHTPIVRFQDAWGAQAGCIPLPEFYGDFAIRIANFVNSSQGCSRWIIGNEMNFLSVEAPQGHPILPSSYARCFLYCERGIHAQPGHENDEVIPGAIAPWNNQTQYPENPTGDWVFYHRDVLKSILALGGKVGGIAIHAYSHGADPALISSTARMGAPFEHRYYNFKVFEEFMYAIPHALRTVPVYITEADQNDPWENANRGWVRSAYSAINAWNQRQDTQKIWALVLYRWRGDRWAFYDKPKVIEDFQQAVAQGYTVPDTTPPPDPEPPEPEPDETWTFTVDIDIEATSSTGKTRRWSGELKEVL